MRSKNPADSANSLAVGQLEQRTRHGLRTKLFRVYTLQVLLISVAALIGVYITYIIVEDLLTRQALTEEAAHYWALRAEHPEHPLPDTANMKGYLHDPAQPSALPNALLSLSPGFGRAHDLPGQPLVHVSRKDDRTLYLVFAEGEVADLVFYFGLAPLAAVLLTVYALLFLTYRLSHQAISPMLNVAQALERFDFRSTNKLQIPTQAADVDRETRLMVEALQEFSDRLEQFIERERTFTRDAGHELRTPIAVLKGSLDILQADSARPDQDREVIARMRRVVTDMETLLSTLLMLAREEEVFADGVSTSVNQVVAEEIERYAPLAEQHDNTVEFVEHVESLCQAKMSVLSIIVGNLLRNALTYTQHGQVTITVYERSFSIADTGIGMSPEDTEQAFTAFYRGQGAQTQSAGQGLGLALVRRLAQQLNWQVEVSSELGVGTVFKVSYG